jgi:ribosomal protein L37AE/L43A
VTICPGNCNAAWRAAGGPVCNTACRHESCWAITGRDPVLGDPVWCRTDAARIRAQLAQLDDLAALLDYQVNGQGKPATSPAGGPESPSPSPSGDDLFDLKEMLLGWEDAYRHEHNHRYPEQPWLSRPHRGTIASVTTTTIGWLFSHFDGLLATASSRSGRSGYAMDLGLEVGQWHRYLMARTRAGTGRRRGAIPCPRCEYWLLGSAAGTGYWACGGCGRRLDEDEYQELCAVARRLETAS